MGSPSNSANVFNLFADCDDEEVKSHILNAPGKKCTCHYCTFQNIDLIDSCFNKSLFLLTSFKRDKFTLYNDKIKQIYRVNDYLRNC